jgi:DNA-binding NtrC family response regulator
MKTVFIVDDTDFILEILSIYVEEIGMRAITAETGPQALEIFQVQTPDYALIDLSLKIGPQGKELMGVLKVLSPTTKFIAMSGYSEHPIMESPTTYGFEASLIKPFNNEDLKKIL